MRRISLDGHPTEDDLIDIRLMVGAILRKRRHFDKIANQTQPSDANKTLKIIKEQYDSPSNA